MAARRKAEKWDTLPELVRSRLRAKREELGLTQIEVAEQAGLDQGGLSRIEQGKAGLDLPTLAKLAAVLEVEPWKLLRP